MAEEEKPEPEMRGGSHLQQLDSLGQKAVKQASKLQGLAGKSDEDKTPAGGWDDTKFPEASPGYTVKITFHRAANLPFADINTMSSDPYVMAVLKTRLEKRHKQDPDMRLRTRTIHRNTNPEWNTEWVVANIPASGFHLKCRLYDEDPADHDDRLGNVHVIVDSISEGWKGIKEQKFGIKKRMGSKRAYTLRGVGSLFSKRLKMEGYMVVSVECLGKTESKHGGQMYTVGPLPWCRHYSPLIGRIAGTKDTNDDGKNDNATKRYNFQAVQMQFQGPVPEELYHRYVEFKPFVNGMFESHSVKGRVLNRALHHQHARVYNYDRTTVYGGFEKPCKEMTQKFLELVDWDRGGKIFTYVVTLDGLLRFTQTGKEFGIDLLSKHSMHSNVSIYIAFSGEFFIRRLKHPSQHKDSTPDPSTDALPPAPEPAEELDSGQSNAGASATVDTPSGDANSKKEREDDRREQKEKQQGQKVPPAQVDKDPASYQMVIDNDSGTYRPNAKKLRLFKDFLEHNLPGLKVSTLDCQGDADKMQRLKNQQREFKKSSGKYMTYLQNKSQSSISSSDEEELDERAGGEKHEHKYKKEMHKLSHHHSKGSAKKNRKFSGYGDATSSDSSDDETSKGERVRTEQHLSPNQIPNQESTLPVRSSTTDDAAVSPATNAAA